MKKEVLFAIIAGVSIGLVVALGIWNATKLIKKNSPKIIKSETPTPKNNGAIILSGLTNYDVVNKNPILTGLTNPNTDVIVSTQENDYYAKSNSDGEFSIEAVLPAGLSEIKINNTKLLLVFSTEVEDDLKSYVGTITDISSGTIQVKGTNSGILQVSTNDETKYINTLKKNMEVKQTDLAIGDYIVAMGKINGNKVLNTSRILIASPAVENKVTAEKIKIEKLTKTNINNITLPKKWFGPNISELEVGQEIIVTGTTKGDKFDLRSIFIVE